MDRKKLRRDISDILEFPASVAFGTIKLTLIGENRVYVENHKGVLEYTRDRIEISGGKTRVRISGNSLSLQAMTRDDIVIGGRVIAVEFI